MTEETNQSAPDQTTSNDGPTEAEILESLKTKLKTLGGNPGNMGIDALRKKIAEKMAEDEKAAPEEARAQTEYSSIRAKQRAEELRLVRCRISNMNPDKADLPGEIFTVRTKYLGIVKKFIPFGEATENGYHIPYIMYKQLKARKFLHKRTTTNKKTGQIDLKTNWVSEFSLEVLPPLTKEELKDLAHQQAAAAGLSD